MPIPAPISVALVNDYEIVVRGLADMLSDFRDRVDVIELDSRLPVANPVDVVLYDTFALPQGHNQQIAEVISNPNVGRVVVYSWNTDYGLVEGTLAQGAHGYLSKTLGAESVVDSIERVNAGETVVDTGHRQPAPASDWPGRADGLTMREAEVLALITQGMSNAEIADHTHVSINSVKTYIRNAYRKIGVNNRTHAVLWGVQHGFLPDVKRVINH